MVRTQISLDEEMYRDAQEQARRQGISFAELCRRGLEILLKREAKDRPWLSFAGSIDTGDPNSSGSVDDVVYGRDRP